MLLSRRLEAGLLTVSLRTAAMLMGLPLLLSCTTIGSTPGPDIHPNAPETLVLSSSTSLEAAALATLEHGHRYFKLTQMAGSDESGPHVLGFVSGFGSAAGRNVYRITGEQHLLMLDDDQPGAWSADEVLKRQSS